MPARSGCQQAVDARDEYGHDDEIPRHFAPPACGAGERTPTGRGAIALKDIAIALPGAAIIRLRRHFEHLPYRVVSIDDFGKSYRNRRYNGNFVMAINLI
jgi:hypothetical protein